MLEVTLYKNLGGGAGGNKSPKESKHSFSPLNLLAVLDFPDEITFHECPVRYTSTKTLLVRNIGDRPAKFKMSVAGPPFYPRPNAGFLDVGAIMQLDMDFVPEV